jgi:hypothetical protein
MRSENCTKRGRKFRISILRRNSIDFEVWVLFVADQKHKQHGRYRCSAVHHALTARNPPRASVDLVCDPSYPTLRFTSTGNNGERSGRDKRQTAFNVAYFQTAFSVSHSVDSSTKAMKAERSRVGQEQDTEGEDEADREMENEEGRTGGKDEEKKSKQNKRKLA